MNASQNMENVSEMEKDDENNGSVQLALMIAGHADVYSHAWVVSAMPYELAPLPLWVFSPLPHPPFHSASNYPIGHPEIKTRQHKYALQCRTEWVMRGVLF